MNNHLPDRQKAEEHIKLAEMIMDKAENMPADSAEFRDFTFEAYMASASNHIALARYYQRRNRA